MSEQQDILLKVSVAGAGSSQPRRLVPLSHATTVEGLKSLLLAAFSQPPTAQVSQLHWRDSSNEMLLLTTPLDLSCLWSCVRSGLSLPISVVVHFTSSSPSPVPLAAPTPLLGVMVPRNPSTRTVPRDTLRWQRGQVLGRGAFGTVYLGLHLDSAALMAVKCLDVSDPATLQSVEAEVDLLSRLSHPNIISYLGTQRGEGVEEGTLNIFLEYASGGSLKQLLERFGPLTGPTEAPLRTWLRHILLGLEYLHRNGFAHRDLKPANVLLASDGSAKLADFGKAKRWSGTASTGGGGGGSSSAALGNSNASTVQGTPLYMAPEVIREQGSLTRGWRKADVWSVGCIVVELCSGRPPWDGLIQNAMQAMYVIACTEQTPPIPDTLSPLGKDFLAHCFQRDPEKRPSVTLLLLHPFVASSSSSSGSGAGSSTLAFNSSSSGSAEGGGVAAPTSPTPPLSSVSAVGSGGSGNWGFKPVLSASSSGSISTHSGGSSGGGGRSSYALQQRPSTSSGTVTGSSSSHQRSVSLGTFQTSQQVPRGGGGGGGGGGSATTTAATAAAFAAASAATVPPSPLSPPFHPHPPHSTDGLPEAVGLEEEPGAEGGDWGDLMGGESVSFDHPPPPPPPNPLPNGDKLEIQDLVGRVRLPPPSLSSSTRDTLDAVPPADSTPAAPSLPLLATPPRGEGRLKHLGGESGGGVVGIPPYSPPHSFPSPPSSSPLTLLNPHGYIPISSPSIHTLPPFASPTGDSNSLKSPGWIQGSDEQGRIWFTMSTNTSPANPPPPMLSPSHSLLPTMVSGGGMMMMPPASPLLLNNSLVQRYQQNPPHTLAAHAPDGGGGGGGGMILPSVTPIPSVLLPPQSPLPGTFLAAHNNNVVSDGNSIYSNQSQDMSMDDSHNGFVLPAVYSGSGGGGGGSGGVSSPRVLEHPVILPGELLRGGTPLGEGLEGGGVLKSPSRLLHPPSPPPTTSNTSSPSLLSGGGSPGGGGTAGVLAPSLQSTPKLSPIRYHRAPTSQQQQQQQQQGVSSSLLDAPISSVSPMAIPGAASVLSPSISNSTSTSSSSSASAATISKLSASVALSPAPLFSITSPSTSSLTGSKLSTSRRSYNTPNLPPLGPALGQRSPTRSPPLHSSGDAAMYLYSLAAASSISSSSSVSSATTHTSSSTPAFAPAANPSRTSPTPFSLSSTLSPSAHPQPIQLSPSTHSAPTFNAALGGGGTTASGSSISPLTLLPVASRAGGKPGSRIPSIKPLPTLATASISSSNAPANSASPSSGLPLQHTQQQQQHPLPPSSAYFRYGHDPALQPPLPSSQVFSHGFPPNERMGGVGGGSAARISSGRGGGGGGGGGNRSARTQKGGGAVMESKAVSGETVPAFPTPSSSTASSSAAGAGVGVRGVRAAKGMRGGSASMATTTTASASATTASPFTSATGSGALGVSSLSPPLERDTLRVGGRVGGKLPRSRTAGIRRPPPQQQEQEEGQQQQQHFSVGRAVESVIQAEFPSGPLPAVETFSLFNGGSGGKGGEDERGGGGGVGEGIIEEVRKSLTLLRAKSGGLVRPKRGVGGGEIGAL